MLRLRGLAFPDTLEGAVMGMGPVAKSVELPNQVSLPYAELGDPSGLPVLLLHGFGDSWRSFELVLLHLPESIRAFALTMRGHGDASRPTSGYGIGDLAADLAQFLDAIPLHAAVIVGHSMGSGVALRFAIDHPERTMGLVLVGASPTMGATVAAREFWDSSVSKLTDPVDAALVRGMTESMLTQPVPKAFVDAAVQEGLKVPAFVWKAAFESRWRLEGDYSAGLSRIKAPTLIVWGVKMRAIRETNRTRLPQRSQARGSLSIRGRAISSIGRNPSGLRRIS
jgi:pimeloyl-ACP methyl ester carboxylesterase